MDANHVEELRVFICVVACLFARMLGHAMQGSTTAPKPSLGQKGSNWISDCPLALHDPNILAKSKKTRNNANKDSKFFNMICIHFLLFCSVLYC